MTEEWTKYKEDDVDKFRAYDGYSVRIVNKGELEHRRGRLMTTVSGLNDEIDQITSDISIHDDLIAGTPVDGIEEK